MNSGYPIARASWVKDNPTSFEVLVELLEGEDYWMPGETWVGCGMPSPGTWVVARQLAATNWGPPAGVLNVKVER